MAKKYFPNRHIINAVSNQENKMRLKRPSVPVNARLSASLSASGPKFTQPGFELPGPHTLALRTLLETLRPQEFVWILTGSASLRLQGVDVTVNDLDLECQPQAIRRIEQALSEYITTPVHLWESDRIRSLDGKALLGGVDVELIADLEVLDSDGSWKKVIDFEQRIWLEWQGLQLPVFPLEIEAAAYQAMGRLDKTILITSTIQRLNEGEHG
jgi:hypothetical protein